MVEDGERRKHQRIRFETRVDLVYKGVGGFASVRTGNLSAGGLFVMLSQPPAPGTPVDFGLVVGAKGLHRGFGEVVWVRPAEAADEYPAGFGLRVLGFREGSPELIAGLVGEVLAGAEVPTGHGEEEAPAPAETLAARIPTAPIAVDETAEAAGSRTVSDRTTAVLTLDAARAAAAGPETSEAVEGEETAEAAAPSPPGEPGGGEPAGVATVVAPLAELVDGGADAPSAETPDGAGAASPSPVQPDEGPVGVATLVTPIADLTAGETSAPPPVPPSVPPDAEPQATTVFDIRQAMAAMQEFQGGAASATAAQPAPAPAPPAGRAIGAEEPSGPPPEAPPPAAPAGERPAPAVKPESAKPANEQARPAPAKPAAATVRAPEAAAKPAAAPEARPVAAAPPKAEVKERRPRRPVSKGLLRLAVLVLVAGGVYFVSAYTEWGRETTPAAMAWVKETSARLTGKATPSDAGSPAPGPQVAPAEKVSADEIVEVTWEGDGPTTLITVTANGPLTDDRVLHQELSRPPRSLIRVKGVNRPFTGFHERTDVPRLVGLRVGNHFELHPPELFVVAEPEAGAVVTRVEVSGSAILIEVAVQPTPTPKPKRGR